MQAACVQHAIPYFHSPWVCSQPAVHACLKDQSCSDSNSHERWNAHLACSQVLRMILPQASSTLCSGSSIWLQHALAKLALMIISPTPLTLQATAGLQKQPLYLFGLAHARLWNTTAAGSTESQQR